MKMLRILVVFVIVAAVGIGLITTRPTKSEFASWYVGQNESGFGGFFDEAFKAVVEQRTNVESYLIFSVFEVDGETRYVGILDHFFGRNTVDEAKKTVNNLIRQVEEALAEKK